MGAEKIFGSAQINFFHKFWSEDPPKKKVFFPNYAQWIRAVCLLSWHNSDLKGYVYSLAGCDGILWYGPLSLPINSSVKTPKKGFSARNLGLSLGLHLCFSSCNETLLTLGGAQAVIWRAWPRNALRGAGPALPTL